MSNRIKTIALACGLSATLGASAFAGFKANGNVVIYPAVGIVDGVPGTARNSPDSMQFIGCRISVPFLGAKQEGLCLARDAAGTYAVCYTDDPEQLAVMRSLNGDSAIRFIYNEVGGCKHLAVENMSYYEPKTP